MDRNTLNRLLDERQAAVDKAQRILEKAEAEGRDLSGQDEQDWQDAMAQVRSYDQRIADVQEAIGSRDHAAQARQGIESVVRPPHEPEHRSLDGARHRDDQPVALSPEQRMAHVVASDSSERNLSLGALVRGMATGRWDGAEAEARALGTGTGAAGGFIVPSTLSAELIDNARAQTRVIQAGARTFPLDAAEVKVAKLTGDPQADWRSEHGTIPESDASFDQIVFQPKALAVITRLSRELLEDGVNTRQRVEQDIAASVAVELDRVALRGSGTDPEPQGVRNHPDVTVTELGSGDGATPTYEDLIDAIGRVQDANHTPTNRIQAPRTSRTFAAKRDANNQFLEPPQMVAEVPALDTTQVPTDLTVGTSNDCSEIYTGDWSEVYVGLRNELAMTLLTEKYADVGEVGVLAWVRADIAVARGAALDVITGVRP